MPTLGLISTIINKMNLRYLVLGLILFLPSFMSCKLGVRFECYNRLAMDPVLRRHLESWIENKLVNNPDLLSNVEFHPPGGIGFYRVNINFDWKYYEIESDYNVIKLLGEYDKWKGVVFLNDSKCALVYVYAGSSLSEVINVPPDEVMKIDDKFYFYKQKSNR